MTCIDMRESIVTVRTFWEICNVSTDFVMIPWIMKIFALWCWHLKMALSDPMENRPWKNDGKIESFTETWESGLSVWPADARINHFVFFFSLLFPSKHVKLLRPSRICPDPSCSTEAHQKRNIDRSADPHVHQLALDCLPFKRHSHDCSQVHPRAHRRPVPRHCSSLHHGSCPQIRRMVVHGTNSISGCVNEHNNKQYF